MLRSLAKLAPLARFARYAREARSLRSASLARCALRAHACERESVRACVANARAYVRTRLALLFCNVLWDL